MDIRGGNINGISITGADPLYTFTNFTFTNGNSVGRLGPTTSNLRALYNTSGNTWINSDNYFGTDNGIQLWTVPVTGTYTVTATGAKGGGGDKAAGGASITGTFTLNRGEVVKIVAGQVGANVNIFYGSGGGGSFVVRSPYNTLNSIVVIAGGAGGYTSGGTLIAQSAGNAAVTPGYIGTVRANVGGGGGGTSSSGGLNGANGADQFTAGYPGGGGGFFGNGGGSGNGANPYGGIAFTKGAYGGTGGAGEAVGGFGCGGGGSARGAGGGGFNGGNAGNNDYAAGGGSYNNGTNQTNTGNVNFGNGYVTITFVGAA